MVKVGFFINCSYLLVSYLNNLIFAIEIRNACTKFGACSQICEDVTEPRQWGMLKDVRCSCISEFEVDPKNPTRCKPKDAAWKLLYTTYSQIVGYVTFDANGMEVGRSIIANEKEKAGYFSHALAYDFKNNVVYWTDVTSNNEAIYMKSLDANSKIEVVVDNGIQFSGGIAFDWITGSLYFSDLTLSHIVVCSATRNLCAILMSNLYKPGDIALYPSDGLMFYSYYFDGAIPTIAKVGMDGSNPTPIVKLDKTPNLIPVAIAVDLVSIPRLYFVDPSTNNIESVQLNGMDRRSITSQNGKPTYFNNVDILGDLLLWNDQNYESIEIKTADKFYGYDPAILLRKVGFPGIKIAVFHSSRQPIYRTNPCLISNCSHICTLTPDPNTFQCFCPVGMNLGKDGKTCKEPENLPKLLLAYGNTLKMMRFNSIGREVFEERVNLATIQTIQAIVYNSINNSIILSDMVSQKIYEYSFVQKTLEVLVDQGIKMIKAMDLDPVAENLYWIDVDKQTLEVFSLRTKARAVLRSEIDTPFDLLLVLQHRYLLLSYLENGVGVICSMSLSGKESHIVYRNRELVELTYYDKETDLIYWSDSKNTRIASLSLFGEGAKDVVNTTGGRTDAFIHENQIYWLDSASNYIMSKTLSKNGGSRKIRISERIHSSRTTPTMTIIGRDHESLKNLTKANDCSIQGKFKDCSHLCLLGKHDNGKCACPEGLILDVDNKTCMCLGEGQFRCDNNDTCIDPMYKCNGFRDCPGGEDEINCEETFLGQGGDEFLKNEEMANMSKLSQQIPMKEDFRHFKMTIIIALTCTVATIVIMGVVITFILTRFFNIEFECLGWSVKIGCTF